MNDFIIDTKKYPKPRSRHHNASNVYFPLHQLEKTPRYYPPLIQSMDWNICFADGNPPSVLDIGCGWGSFMMNYAIQHGKINILGIEIRNILTDWINTVIDGENIHNAHALWYSLPNGIPFIQDDTINEFFSFFPDPWIKKKHHKRRAFTSDLIQECIRVSKQQSYLYLMTDVPEVAKYQIELLETFPECSMDYLEFCGEEEPQWKELLSSFPKLTAVDDIWTLPMTDQEKFSLKKSIPYLRCRYTITKC